MSWEKVKLKDEVKELKNLVEELKADAIKKDTRLGHLQKRTDKLCSSLEEAKVVAIREFKASSKFTDLLDKKYVAGFEDFHMDTIESFSGVDFSPIKLRVATKISLLQTSSEDDASTPQPVKDVSKSRGIAPNGLSK